MSGIQAAGPLDFHPEMKKVVTSSPTVTLMVTRIPSTITEEGVNNLFLECGTVLNFRLVINKGGFAGIRGLNYAYVTLATSDEATLAIEKLNMQPPLNLGVALKPSEEERLKTREQDLLNRAFGS
jgi:RNA recognition motif-containing protein